MIYCVGLDLSAKCEVSALYLENYANAFRQKDRQTNLLINIDILQNLDFLKLRHLRPKQHEAWEVVCAARHNFLGALHPIHLQH